MSENTEKKPLLKALIEQFRHNLLAFMKLRSASGAKEVLRAASKALQRHDFVRSVNTYLLEKERLKSVSATEPTEDLSLTRREHPAVRALSRTCITHREKEGYIDFAAAVGMPPGPVGVVHARLTCDDADARLLTRHLLAAVSDRLRLLQVPREGGVTSAAPAEPSAAQPPTAEAREDLFAAVVHEISNPLAAILAHLDVLRMERSEDPVVAEHLKSVMPQLTRLSGLLDSARTYTRASFEAEGAVDVAKGLHALASLLKHHYHAHNVELELTVPRELPPVRGSSSRLQQVWLNYLNNAFNAVCRKVPPSGRILVKVKHIRKLRRLVVEIIDDGVGMDAETLASLRASWRHGAAGPAGIGTREAARIIEEHNGSVDISSAPGEGTTVRVTLPTAESPGLTILRV